MNSEIRERAAQVPVVTLQMLSDAGLNPFAFQLLAESLLKGPRLAGPVEFVLPIQRSDCPGWSGVLFRMEPIPVEEASKETP